MKILLPVCLFLMVCFHQLNGQTSFDYTVPVTVQAQEDPPQITLNWPLNDAATGYTVGRKLLTSTFWTTLATGLPGTATSYTDNTVAIGTAYEYRVVRTGSPATGTSYVYAGIRVPAREYRGKMILLVDDYFTVTLASEIKDLESSLIGDGWVVIRHDVSRTDAVRDVKNIIVNDYNADKTNVKALFLLGHVPVPYSGNINPDGHPDHQGAWPADVYYADVNGLWTDATINNTSASRVQNDNIPGDGKFDQSQLPSDVDLLTGRVDFYDMPAFALSETELMRNYLNRLINYKFRIFNPPQTCIVDDNFGAFSGEAFGSNGWRIGSVVSPGRVSAQDYFTTLNATSSQWSYGCGGGSYTSCSGVGNTSMFAAAPVQTVFTMVFGSYFGDWDSQNNFLRAPLASGALTSVWAGRPWWHFHTMSLGEPIGVSTRLTQNNSSLYAVNFPPRAIHTALMGDPSLRQHIVAPPYGLKTEEMGPNAVGLRWSHSQDSVLGYYVYRLDTASMVYNRISPDIVADTTFTDAGLSDKVNHYMVRAVTLETSVTGSYYNLSQGILDTISIIINSTETPDADRQITVYPNPADGKCRVTSDSGIESVTIYDACLRPLGTFKVNAQEMDIDVSGYAPGIYLLRVDGVCKKLIVTR